MLERNSPLIRQIEAALLQEVELQLRYSAAIEEEKACITKLHSERIAVLTAKREEIARAILSAKERRESLTSKIPGAEHGKSLRAILKEKAHKDDARRISQLASKLEVLVHDNRKRGREFSRLVNFASTIIDGSMSILRSATQSITRAYGRNGVLREKIAPNTRTQGTLEEA